MVVRIASPLAINHMKTMSRKATNLRIILQRMALAPEQNLQIAAAYEKAATDYTVPPQHRKAFARKAEWFRMLARLGAKQKLFAVPPQERPVIGSPHAPHARGMRTLSKARHLFAWQQSR